MCEGTLNAGYYAIAGGKHTQIRLWGSRGCVSTRVRPDEYDQARVDTSC
jgi:hypothetical protein